MGKTCGETFGLVRFHGAGAGCGVRVRVRVRFTCGQDFARTAGSDILIIKKIDVCFKMTKNTFFKAR